MFPQAFVVSITLCTGKSGKLYKVIFSDLRQKASAASNGLPLIRKRFHADFEIAALKAFAETFGDIGVIIVGCQFHLSQVIYYLILLYF